MRLMSQVLYASILQSHSVSFTLNFNVFAFVGFFFFNNSKNYIETLTFPNNLRLKLDNELDNGSSFRTVTWHTRREN